MRECGVVELRGCGVAGLIVEGFDQNFSRTETANELINSSRRTQRI